MARVGTHIRGPLVSGPELRQGDYAYRKGMGMVSCAEFAVWHYDFGEVVASNAIPGFTGVADTGGSIATTTTATTGAYGVLTLTSDDASEGAVMYGNKGIQLIAGKRFFMEVRVRTNDVTDNAVQFGLSDLTAVTNPEDLWTTTAANVVAFGILDGAATTYMLSDASNGGTSAQAGNTGTGNIMVADTWHVMAIEYTGSTATGNTLHGYLDGKKVLSWSSAASTVPTATALAPFIGALNGNGAGGNLTYYDYIRMVAER